MLNGEWTMRRLIRAAIAAMLLVGGLTVIAAQPAAAATTCAKFGLLTIQNGRYNVQNNVWGADTAQCINTTTTGFSVTRADHNKPPNGAPAAYPSVYFGCHFGNCSSGSGLPLQASNSAFNGVRTSVSMSYPGSGTWDAAYDIWFDPTARTNGQNTGAEIMVWLNRRLADDDGHHRRWHLGRLVRQHRLERGLLRAHVGDRLGELRGQRLLRRRDQPRLGAACLVPDQHPGRLRTMGRRHRPRRHQLLRHSLTRVLAPGGELPDVRRQHAPGYEPRTRRMVSRYQWALCLGMRRWVS
jgi:hypothetical protein